MNGRKIRAMLIIAVNMIGAVCLTYFAVLFVTHDTAVKGPDAMLPAEAWDNAGMMLTFGFIPLLIANVSGFVFVKSKRKWTRFLFLFPSVICFIIVICYWTTALA